MDIPQNLFNQYTSNFLKNCGLSSEINFLEKEIFGFNVDDIDSKNNITSFLQEFSLIIQDCSEEVARGFIRTKIELALTKGSGVCLLILGMRDSVEIGIDAEGEVESFKLLESLCIELNLSHKLIERRAACQGHIIEMKIVANTDKYNTKSMKPEVKIGLFGEESCGKSTLIGVIVNGVLDDGDGFARTNIFRFQHEQYSGKTSNFSHYIAGLNDKGELINSETLPIKSFNDPDNKSRLLWEDVIHYSAKIVSLYDMGGSSKLTLSLFSDKYIDYFSLIINPILGLAVNTRIYLKLAIKLNLPIFIVITAADLVEPKALEMLVQDIKSFIKSIKCQRMPMLVASQKDAILFSRNIDEAIIPILAISSKSGEGISYLVSFINALETNKQDFKNKEEMMFDIHEHFYASIQKKVVVAGFVSKGKLSLGQKCYLGPNKQGQFTIIEIEGLHCKKIPTRSASRGEFVTLCLKKDGLTSEQIRKGMVLLDLAVKPRQVKTFECELYSLDSQEKQIKYKYEPVVNIRNIRHCCKIKKPFEKKSQQNTEEEEKIRFGEDCMSKFRTSPSASTLNSSSYNNLNAHYQISEYNGQPSCSKDSFMLKENNKVTVKFEFKNFTEYIEEGDVVIVNEPYMRAYGIITKCEQT